MAWNDPQWGNKDNRKNSGPPDLDELWRRINQRLNGMFGGKGRRRQWRRDGFSPAACRAAAIWSAC